MFESFAILSSIFKNAASMNLQPDIINSKTSKVYYNLNVSN